MANILDGVQRDGHLEDGIVFKSMAVRNERHSFVSLRHLGDGNYCYDESSDMIVHASECPHDCCIEDGEHYIRCGTEDACKAAATWALISTVICCAGCCGGTVGIVYCIQKRNQMYAGPSNEFMNRYAQQHIGIVIPESVGPGQACTVQAPSGQQFQVVRPPNYVPGSTLVVSIPPPETVMAVPVQPPRVSTGPSEASVPTAVVGHVVPRTATDESNDEFFESINQSSPPEDGVAQGVVVGRPVVLPPVQTRATVTKDTE